MAALRQDDRLRVLRSTGLLDSPPEHAFDRLTRLAAGLTGAPVALVSLVDEHRQFFKSALGLKEPWASRRETPLTHSFCKLTARDRVALVVGDAREHPVLKDNLAIRDLGVIAYAGVPLVVDGQAVGAFCVVDDKPRQWTEDEVGLVHDLAEAAVSEIELRMAGRRERTQRALLDAVLESAGDAVLAVDAEERFVVANGAARRLFPFATPGAELPRSGVVPSAKLADGSLLPVDAGPLRRALRGAVTDGLLFGMELAGERRWLEANGRPIRDTDGTILGAIAVIRDVTETKRQSDLYRAVVGHIPGGVVLLFDRDQRCLAIDGEVLREAGRAPEAFVGKTIREIAGDGGADAIEPIEDAFRRTLEGEAARLDVRCAGRTFALQTTPVRDALGAVERGLVLAHDVSLERSLQTELRQRGQIQRAILQHLPNAAALVVDRDLRYVAADGPALSRLIKMTPLDEVVGKTAAQVASDANRAAIVDMYRRTLGGERCHAEVERDGHVYDLETVPIDDGDAVSHALAFLYDVTDRKAQMRELEKARAKIERSAAAMQQASMTDELTGLHNRRGFMLLADQALKVAARGRGSLAVVFIDLNGMKHINDELGHEMGDRALVTAAEILRRVFRASDVLARLGGDEFVALATGATEPAVRALETRLRLAVLDYNATTTPFRLSLSVGAAFHDPDRPLTIEELLAEADRRMYAEKVRRESSRIFIKASS